MAGENENLENLKQPEDFEVIIKEADVGTKEIDIETKMEKIANSYILSAIEKYDPSNSNYSVYLKDTSTNDENLTLASVAEMAKDAQSDINKVIKINDTVRQQININYIIGRVVEAIEDNINSEYRVSYNTVEGRNKKKILDRAKALVSDFFTNIDIENFIRKAISTTYFEGNFITCLRKTGTHYYIDSYPLGVAIISDYELNGNPVILIDIKALENRIKKTMVKTRKNKALFFEKTEDEIKTNYPPEVYEAYKNKEKYAKLDVETTRVMRVNNLNRKYGVTPIFKSLTSIVMLNTFDLTNQTISKSKAKRIIVQHLSDSLPLGNKAFAEMSYAHDNFMQAWKQPTVIVTTPPSVKEVKYIEPKAETTNTDLILLYQNRALTALGIGFLANEKSLSGSIANINLQQLMLTINKISKQLETLLREFCIKILDDNGISKEFAPSISVLDSEQMDYDLKLSLAGLMYSTLNCSLKTTLEILGFNSEDEFIRRQNENEQGYSETFTPRGTSFTFSGDSGRPADSKDLDKQLDDKTNNS